MDSVSERKTDEGCEKCGRPVRAKRLCGTHYSQALLRRKGERGLFVRLPNAQVRALKKKSKQEKRPVESIISQAVGEFMEAAA